MWEQHKGFNLLSERKSSKDHSSMSSGCSKATSKGLTKGSKSGNDASGFVSRLGFKFDVANFDINAVSPTSWWSHLINHEFIVNKMSLLARDQRQDAAGRSWVQLLLAIPSIHLSICLCLHSIRLCRLCNVVLPDWSRILIQFRECSNSRNKWQHGERWRWWWPTLCIVPMTRVSNCLCLSIALSLSSSITIHRSHFSTVISINTQFASRIERVDAHTHQCVCVRPISNGLAPRGPILPSVIGLVPAR